MRARPEQPSDSGSDTLPEIPAVAETESSDFAKIARDVRRRRAVRRAREALAEVAKETPGLVLEFINGIWP